MPLYEMMQDSFRPISQSSFTDLKILERNDIQRLLRTQIEVLGDDLYVLSEEFGEWEDSRRRIDLLAIDQQANLVIIELKRTQDGGHMELQGIRYAAMVSAITFERAEQIHAEFLGRIGEPKEEAEARMLAFLNWDEPDEENFANDVRILLVSEDFGKELTTAVLWLRDRDIDIRCIRLQPYLDGETRLIDVQQIIPLPEAQDYQVQLRQKELVGRKQRVEREELLQRFWEGLLSLVRSRGTRHSNLKARSYDALGATSGIQGLRFNFVVTQEFSYVDLYIDRGDKDENKRVFDALHASRDEVDARFGAPLIWKRLNENRACRIKFRIESGGYRSPEEDWPKIHAEMISSMAKLEAALKPALDRLEV